MKVALVTHSFLPRFMGGREKFCLDLAKASLNIGINCEVFCGDKIKKSFTENYEGVVTHRFPNWTLKFGIYPYRFVHLDLWKELSKYNPDVIHVLDYRHFTTDVSVWWSKLKKKPLVMTVHGLGYDMNWWMHKALAIYDLTLGRFSLKNIDKVIVYPNSAWIKRLDSEKITIISQAFSMPLETKVDFTNHFEVKEPYALCIGRLVHIKGFEPVVEAFKELNYKLVIIGGDVNSAYGQHLQQLNNNVLFTGYLPYEWVCSALNSCRFYIQSSLDAEGFTRTLLEAMSFGKPILCHKADYYGDLVNEEHARIVDFMDRKSLCDAIEEFFVNDYSSLGRKARETILPFTWENVVKRFIKVYEEVIEWI